MQGRRRVHAGNLNTEYGYEHGHFMLKIYTPIIIMTGLFVITCGLFFKPLKAAAGKQKMNARKIKIIPVILESVTNKKIIKKILDFLASDKNFILNRLGSGIVKQESTCSSCIFSKFYVLYCVLF
jgi:hypothetical protein